MLMSGQHTASVGNNTIVYTYIYMYIYILYHLYNAIYILNCDYDTRIHMQSHTCTWRRLQAIQGDRTIIQNRVETSGEMKGIGGGC